MLQRCHVLPMSVIFLLYLAGCTSSGVGVSTTFDPLTAFPMQATYAWDDAANELPKDPRLQTLDLDSLIKEAANEEFAARGYRQATTGSPDYSLTYQLTVHTWTGPDNSRSIGSLSLMLVEAGTSHRVWTGFAKAEVHVGLNREQRKKRLREALTGMLAKFPPKQQGE